MTLANARMGLEQAFSKYSISPVADDFEANSAEALERGLLLWQTDGVIDDGELKMLLQICDFSDKSLREFNDESPERVEELLYHLKQIKERRM